MCIEKNLWSSQHLSSKFFLKQCKTNVFFVLLSASELIENNIYVGDEWKYLKFSG